jgi:hypothetical protein
MAQAVSRRPVSLQTGLDPSSVHVKHVLEQEAVGQNFLRVIHFLLSASFYQSSILLLQEVQTGDAWDASKKQCCFRTLIKKYFTNLDFKLSSSVEYRIVFFG